MLLDFGETGILLSLELQPLHVFTGLRHGCPRLHDGPVSLPLGMLRAGEPLPSGDDGWVLGGSPAEHASSPAAGKLSGRAPLAAFVVGGRERGRPAAAEEPALLGRVAGVAGMSGATGATGMAGVAAMAGMAVVAHAGTHARPGGGGMYRFFLSEKTHFGVMFTVIGDYW